MYSCWDCKTITFIVLCRIQMETVHHLFDEKLNNNQNIVATPRTPRTGKAMSAVGLITIRPANQANATRTKEIIISLNYTNFSSVTFLSHPILSSVFIVCCAWCGAWCFCCCFISIRIHYPSHKECILYLSGYQTLFITFMGIHDASTFCPIPQRTLIILLFNSTIS